MASNDYHFTTHWRIHATQEEIYDILSNASDLPRWWPTVYLETRVLLEGDDFGVGKVVELLTRGRLPYSLKWWFRVEEAVYPAKFRLEAWGDFIGTGNWEFRRDGEFVDVTYDWRIKANKPPASTSVMAAETCLRRQPPVGDGPGRNSSQDGACPTGNRRQVLTTANYLRRAAGYRLTRSRIRVTRSKPRLFDFAFFSNSLKNT